MSRGQGTTANNNQQENNNFLLARGGSTTIVIDFSNNTALLLSVAMQLLAMFLCGGVDVCSGDALGSLSAVWWCNNKFHLSCVLHYDDQQHERKDDWTKKKNQTIE